MKQILNRSFLLSLALMAWAGLTASAQTPAASPTDIQKDRRDIRQDTRDIRTDRRDLRGDVKDRNADVRDLTGLCLFDEHGSRMTRPDRSPVHVTRLLQTLADAAALAPASARAEPDHLIPVAA